MRAAPAVPASTQTGTSRALRTRREPSGRRSALSSTMRTGEFFAMPGNRQVSIGSSASAVPMPTMMASLCARMQMDALAHRLAGDRDRPAARRTGFAVGGDRELEHDMRAAVAHAPDMAGMVAPRLLGADADVDRNARRAQPRMARRPRLRDWDLPCADTTRAMPAAMTASAQGGDLP